MVYFTEKLINEIRKRSCIWDTADVNHLNKEMLTNMWTEIAETLYSDWHTLGVFDKRDRGKQNIILFLVNVLLYSYIVVLSSSATILN